MLSRKSVRALLAAVAVVVAFAALPALANADFPQTRISHFGTDGDLTQQAGFPDVAYNSQTNQYLVVYEAGASTDTSHWVIYGQMVDATGAPVGGPITVSAPTGNELCWYEPPAVAYSDKLNQFLISWDEGTASDCDDTIHVQRLAGDGSLIGTPSQQISATGFTDIETSVPIYNPDANEWLVVWKGDVPGTSNQEAFGQRLSASGDEVGTDDQKLTDFTGAGGNADDAISVAFDATDGRYLVTVRGNDPTQAPLGDEVYGHLMTSDGTAIGAPQFRISHTTDTNSSGNANPATAIWDPTDNKFFVAWNGNPMLGSMAANEIEVSGRFVGPDGSLLGTSDQRYSDMGPDGSTAYFAARPDLGFNPNANEFFMSWHGDDNTAPLVDNEQEVFGQRVDATGAEIGDNDFRISHDGPDGDVNFAANRPALAYNSSTCQYLDVWSTGKVGNLGSNNEEWDVYGNLVDSPCPPVNRSLPQISGTAQAGQQLSCSNGTWSARNVSFATQWLNNGVPIANATAANYTPGAGDVGHQVACKVTATDPDGTASATSAAVSPIAAPVQPLPKDTTPPSCKAAIARQKLGKVLSKGLKVKLTCSEPSRLAATLFASSKTLKVVHSARTVKVGSGQATTSPTGTATITVKLTKKAKKALKNKRNVKLTLRIKATDAAGNAKTTSKTLKLKR